MIHLAKKYADGIVSAIVETKLLSDSVTSPVETIPKAAAV
jgi:hypothetical protein